MISILSKVYSVLPNFLQNILISAYNLKSYKYRYGGKYKDYKLLFRRNAQLSKEELSDLQLLKLKEFLKFAQTNSDYYRKAFKGYNFDSFKSVRDLQQLPFLNKDILRKNRDILSTISKSNAIVGKTGGTTGASLEVLYIKEDVQARFAFVDNVRSSFGYELGKRTAWFSGKNLLSVSDINKKVFWKSDYIHNVRYYSTYHIQQANLKYYLNNLIEFEAEYFIGFPSNMYELAKYGIRNNINFPSTLKAIFTNAESLTDETRDTITTFFKAKVYDQYSSSEGAPFIFECMHNRYHLELQSGVFEVLDDQNNYSLEGRLVVTSFYTHGTPLIRYEIGDSIRLSQEKCTCANSNPVVSAIYGRSNDYIYSSETGKINSVNIANCVKGTSGIIRFQIIQNEMDRVIIKVIKDPEIYDENIEKTFLTNFKDRLGESMHIDILHVDDIPYEKSGKFRLIKNNINSITEKV